MGTNYYIQTENQNKSSDADDADIGEVIEQFVTNLQKVMPTMSVSQLNRLRVEASMLVVEQQNEVYENMRVHIGKYSAGWRFTLAGDNFKSFMEVKLGENQKIVDEYGRVIEYVALRQKVMSSLDNPWRNNDSSVVLDESNVKNRSEDGFLLVFGDFS